MVPQLDPIHLAVNEDAALALREPEDAVIRPDPLTCSASSALTLILQRVLMPSASHRTWISAWAGVEAITVRLQPFLSSPNVAPRRSFSAVMQFLWIVVWVLGPAFARNRCSSLARCAGDSLDVDGKGSGNGTLVFV